MKYVDNIVMENARLIFRNFSGTEGKYNAAGDRNFGVIIPSEIKDALIADKWNIKTLAPKDPAEEPAYYLPVAVSYKNIPPKIYLISGGKKQLLEELTVNILDWAEIAKVDIVIRPYNWEVNGKTGVKAYVKNMYVTITEDEFANKYKDVPENSNE